MDVKYGSQHDCQIRREIGVGGQFEELKTYEILNKCI